MPENERDIAWNSQKILSATIGVSWIAVQVAVPLILLFQRGFDRKTRQFGWQMYTEAPHRDDFQVVFNDQTIKEIEIDDYVYNFRPGLAYEENFLAYLCETFPDSKETHRIYDRNTPPQVYQCQN